MQSDAAFEDCKKQTEERIHKLLSIKGHRTVNDIHRELGNIMWEYVGMARNEAGLKTALEKIPALRAEFWENVNVLGSEGSFNQNLERAGRVADFLEFAEVLTLDALHRKESCGGHFREESQTPEGEAKRDDENFFKDGDTIVIEPWRAAAFPVIRDCAVDRTAFDRIIAAGGFVSVNTGAAPEASTIPVPKADADRAFDAAACIGCGACVAACKNASAMLFVSAKVSHLSFLPQGKVEAKKRVLAMVAQMDKEGFGNCTNLYECQAACPKGITVDYIAKMNREYLGATVTYAEKVYGKD